jgi:hypothetical protein
MDELETRNRRKNSHEEANYTTNTYHASRPSIARGLLGRRNCVDEKSTIDCLHYDAPEDVYFIEFRLTVLTSVDGKVDYIYGKDGEPYCSDVVLSKCKQECV